MRNSLVLWMLSYCYHGVWKAGRKDKVLQPNDRGPSGSNIWVTFFRERNVMKDGCMVVVGGCLWKSLHCTGERDLCTVVGVRKGCVGKGKKQFLKFTIIRARQQLHSRWSVVAHIHQLTLMICTNTNKYQGKVWLIVALLNDDACDFISRAHCHVKHSQLCWTNTTCIMNIRNPKQHLCSYNYAQTSN